MEHAAPEPESAAALLKTRLEETQQELQRLQQQLKDTQQQEKDEDPQKPPWVLHICGNPKAEWWLNKMVEMHGKPPDVVYVHQLIREWHEYGGKDKKRKAAQGEMTGEVAQVVGGGELIGEGRISWSRLRQPTRESSSASKAGVGSGSCAPRPTTSGSARHTKGHRQNRRR